MAPAATIDSLPGYRRRFRITPGEGWVRSELEDDFHCMSVTLRHSDGVATSLEAEMVRAPWTTCPGAVQQLADTFAGAPLAGFARRGEKTINCTHLHDLAVLAAAHADDLTPLIYDVLASDPVDGQRSIELRRDGKPTWRLVERNGKLIEPDALAGRSLSDMRDWIDSLPPASQEAVRVLRWGAIVALGRTIPMDQQSRAQDMQMGTCFTFQPARAVSARRVGRIRDFSAGAEQPLGDSIKSASASGDVAR